MRDTTKEGFLVSVYVCACVCCACAAACRKISLHQLRVCVLVMLWFMLRSGLCLSLCVSFCLFLSQTDTPVHAAGCQQLYCGIRCVFSQQSVSCWMTPIAVAFAACSNATILALHKQWAHRCLQHLNCFRPHVFMENWHKHGPFKYVLQLFVIVDECWVHWP